MHQQAAKQLASNLLVGNIEESWNIIRKFDVLGMNSCFVFDQLIADAMHFIGDQWQKNEITVADEHLASGIADFIVAKYRTQMKKNVSQPSDNKAMLFCMEGEEHYLGLKMLAAFLEEKGWKVQLLGSNLPLEYALYSAKRFEPSIIGISLSLSRQIPLLKEYIPALENLPNHPTVIVGGRLVTMYDLRPYCTPTTELFSTMEETQKWLNSFVNV